MGYKIPLYPLYHNYTINCYFATAVKNVCTTFTCDFLKYNFWNKYYFLSIIIYNKVSNNFYFTTLFCKLKNKSQSLKYLLFLRNPHIIEDTSEKTIVYWFEWTTILKHIDTVDKFGRVFVETNENSGRHLLFKFQIFIFDTIFFFEWLLQ